MAKNESGPVQQKNDPCGKAHFDVTATTSQKHGKGTLQQDKTGDSSSGDLIPKTPSGMLGGLRGVLADRPSNQSNDKSVGAGANAKNQSSRPGVSGNAPHWSKNSDNVNFGA